MRVGWIVVAVAALLAPGASVARGVTLPLRPVLISKGHVGQRHWYVIAGPDEHRRGICFEVGIYGRRPSEGEGASGQCSAPAVKRGIVLTMEGAEGRDGLPTMTAVGAAFNMAVERVEVTSFDGSAESLKLRRI